MFCRAFVAACLFQTVAGAIVEEFSLNTLGGISWRVQNVNGSIDILAVVPGQVHLDLLAAEVIGEPYAELNVNAQGWIPTEAAWTYSTSFTPTPALLAKTLIELRADGIDTIASVSLNGVATWSQDNAFHRTTSNVTNLLVPGVNTLTVEILSPLVSAAEAAANCTGFCPPPRSAQILGSKGWNYIRKPPVQFGWDFASNNTPSGIWRSMSLRGFDGAAIDDVTVITTADESTWDAAFTVYLTSATDVSATVSVSIDGAGSGGSGSTIVALHTGENLVNITLFHVSGVLPWWPNGMGAPTLYNTTVTVDTTTSGGSETSSYSFPLGFKYVSLQRPAAPGGQPGDSLYFFTINGAPFYAKGSNWVPPDAFPGRADTAASFIPRFHSFLAAGYNVLRVWGGGYPQPNVFYELAAQMGLLIWQEMPFACAGYPTGENYLPSIAKETTDITRRLQKYSILVWGGNNEVQQTEGYLPGSVGAGNFSLVFFGAVGASVNAADTSRPYLSTSPGSGAETPSNPVAYPVESQSMGDMHVYNYTGDCWDPYSYPHPGSRFTSEFGWQSYSNLPSLAEVFGPAGWSYFSAPMSRRDTHQSQPQTTILYKNVGQNWLIPGYNGTSSADPDARNKRLTGNAAALAAAARAANQTSLSYLQRSDGTFSLPTDALAIAGMMSLYGGPGLANGTVFRDTLLLTQLSQAQCVKTEAEAYRRAQSSCMDAASGGAGCTMGSFYWMANDLWPAATKGSLEWSGRWKVLHHYAADFYAPFLVSAWTRPASTVPPGEQPFAVSVSAHAPAASPLPAALLRLSCWAWGNGHLGDVDIPFSVSGWPLVTGIGPGAGGAVQVYNNTLVGALSACGCSAAAGLAPADCVLSYAVFNASTADPTSFLADNFLYPTPLHMVSSMRDPDLQVADVVETSPGAFNVTITATALPVAGVWVESLLCCGHFSDNALLMTASPMVLMYSPLPDPRGWAHAPPANAPQQVTAGQFAASLSLWSLWDTAPYGGPAK